MLSQRHSGNRRFRYGSPIPRRESTVEPPTALISLARNIVMARRVPKHALARGREGWRASADRAWTVERGIPGIRTNKTRALCNRAFRAYPDLHPGLHKRTNPILLSFSLISFTREITITSGNNLRQGAWGIGGRRFIIAETISASKEGGMGGARRKGEEDVIFS